jgi:hypothetical protein
MNGANFLPTLAGVLGLAVASGINLYAAVLTTGIAVRLGWLTGLPAGMEVLGHNGVLAVAAALYLAEFFADKIPFVTPIWDAIHTFIRPLGGALLALQAAGDLNPVVQVIATILGGSIALGTHSTKAGVRLLAHATPEPASHSALSIAEDVGVVSLLILAYKYPEIAIPVLLALLTGVALVAPLILRVLRFVIAGLLGRIQNWTGSRPAEEIPSWVHTQLNKAQVLHPPEIVRAYTRSGRLWTRLRECYLVRHDRRWSVAQRRLFSGKLKPLGAQGIAEGTLTKGILYDVLVFRGAPLPESFYVTKEWTPTVETMTLASPLT